MVTNYVAFNKEVADFSIRDGGSGYGRVYIFKPHGKIFKIGQFCEVKYID